MPTRYEGFACKQKKKIQRLFILPTYAKKTPDKWQNMPTKNFRL